MKSVDFISFPQGLGRARDWTAARPVPLALRGGSFGFLPSAGSLSAVKLLFAPIGIVTGLLAGAVAQKLFERLWAAVDDEEPPAPDQRQVSVPKLIAALVVEGAIFRLVKGVTDHGVRSGVTRLTGRWPGEEAAERA